jgi:hypothetical protein
VAAGMAGMKSSVLLSELEASCRADERARADCERAHMHGEVTTAVR